MEQLSNERPLATEKVYSDTMEENELFKIKVFLDLVDACDGVSIPIEADTISV